MSRSIRHTVLGAVVVASVAISIFSAAQVVSATRELSNNLSSIEAQPDGYVVRDCDGFVGVYYIGEDSPAVITEIPLENLREYDRELVISSFEVQSRDELMRILEDLGS